MEMEMEMEARGGAEGDFALERGHGRGGSVASAAAHSFPGLYCAPYGVPP
jgi:hypothetical protein